MSKRLVLVFCALFVFAAAMPAFAAVQNVKVSGDILSRWIVRNDFDLEKNATDSKDDIAVFNTVTRLRVDADLTDNVQTAIRVINERNWDNDTTTASSDTDIDLDLAYVTLKEVLCSPLTMTIGRQELHFGNDMIMGDGVGGVAHALVSGGIGTNQTTDYNEATGYGSVNGDLAYRKSFDAIRGTLNYDPLVIDAVYAKIDENVITGGSNDDDIDLWGINAGYQFKDKWNSMVEGYIWTKLDYAGANLSTIDKTDSTNTFGMRVSTNPTGKFNLQQEVAYQGGEKVVAAGVGRERRAWASQTMGTLTPGWKHNPVMGLVYSYFSGEATDSNTDPSKAFHAWDPMFENQTSGHIINALFPQTNCHNVNFHLTLQPSFLEDVTVRQDYVMLFLAKSLPLADNLNLNDYDGTGSLFVESAKTLGQEYDLNILYDYTEDVQVGLLLGWFWPGAAYNRTDGAVQQRSTANEVIASCKVSF